MRNKKKVPIDTENDDPNSLDYLAKAHPAFGGRPKKHRGCSVAGCKGEHVAKGFCQRHYTRTVRNDRPLEAPGDNNPDKQVVLTEDEYARMKEFLSEGFTSKDIAFELGKDIGVINKAVGSSTYKYYTGDYGHDSELGDDDEE